MGWAVGYDSNWKRDIGYGVPAICDHPGCDAEIDRGLAYVCHSEQPYGGDDGCGLYFCGKHLIYADVGEDGGAFCCERCGSEQPPFDPKPDTSVWMRHKLRDPSWGPWRKENPDKVTAIRAELKARAAILKSGSAE